MNKTPSAIQLTDFWSSAFEGIILTDETGRILSLNRIARGFFAETATDDLIGSSVTDFIFSSDLEKCFINKQNMRNVSLSIGTNQLLANVRFMDDDSTLLVMKNVTQLHQLTFQLNQLKKQFRLFDTILDHIDEGICVIDNEKKVVFYNRKLGELETLEPNSVRGQYYLDVFKEADEHSDPLLNSLLTERMLTNRETFFSNQGKEYSVVIKSKPIHLGKEKIGALAIVRDLSEIKKLTSTIQNLQVTEKKPSVPQKKKQNNTRFTFKDIIFGSSHMRQTINKAIRASRSSSNILVYGETGTGKELIVQSIHNESPRKNAPFFAHNCAAIPENLLESILFGTVSGTFTGAVDRPGLFEQANGGTILLDEINSMGISLQAKLLRAIQEKKIMRLGSTKEKSVDVRVIATMNETPEEAIKNKHLREDLFYRLGVVTIHVPPLRKRKEDISLLTEYFIRKHARLLDIEVEGLTEEAKDVLLGFHYPGNVRQLEHIIEGALNLMIDESIVTTEYLPAAIKFDTPEETPFSAAEEMEPTFSDTLPAQVEKLERKLIIKALQETDYHITNAAEKLGISRQNLNYKIKKLSIPIHK
ncbi:sigma 54-interacting transcriptional regulator [Pseudobacillus sp. FSL P4-0506]|uniref:sigma 54-interacting transcriptional regulator n=1 Tax=Pseudobacillus sp. FSL P4-0506 TaxID=2921576 RepID=UPI0030F4E87D